MSLKAMVFIDGGWLYRSRTVLFSKLGETNGFEIDYAKLPRLLCEDIANRLDEDISLVRTNYFGTIPSARSGFNTAKQYSFYGFLGSSCGYDTEIHEIDVTGSGDGRNDESWTKVALTASLMYYAAQPGTFDVAVIVGDDPDLLAAVHRTRLLGKRVQVVGVHAAEGGKKPVPTLFDRMPVSDFPPLYLDDHAAEIRLVRATQVRTCKECGKQEETTWAGPEFFCTACRSKYRN